MRRNFRTGTIVRQDSNHRKGIKLDIKEMNAGGIGQPLLEEKRRCDCKLDTVGPLDQDVFIQYCYLHQAAPDMLKVLNALHDHITFGRRYCAICEQMYPGHLEDCRWLVVAATIATASKV